MDPHSKLSIHKSHLLKSTMESLFNVENEVVSAYNRKIDYFPCMVAIDADLKK